MRPRLNCPILPTLPWIAALQGLALIVGLPLAQAKNSALCEAQLALLKREYWEEYRPSIAPSLETARNEAAAFRKTLSPRNMGPSIARLHAAWVKLKRESGGSRLDDQAIEKLQALIRKDPVLGPYISGTVQTATEEPSEEHPDTQRLYERSLALYLHPSSLSENVFLGLRVTVDKLDLRVTDDKKYLPAPPSKPAPPVATRVFLNAEIDLASGEVRYSRMPAYSVEHMEQPLIYDEEAYVRSKRPEFCQNEETPPQAVTNAQAPRPAPALIHDDLPGRRGEAHAGPAR